jgi:hypothetical protein
MVHSLSASRISPRDYGIKNLSLELNRRCFYAPLMISRRAVILATGKTSREINAASEMSGHAM